MLGTQTITNGQKSSRVLFSPTAHAIQDLASKGQDKRDKDAAKQHLHEADRLIKQDHFDLARREVEKAQKLDSTNQYITAFFERITYFENQKRKGATVSSKETRGQDQAFKPDPPQLVIPLAAEPVLQKQSAPVARPSLPSHREAKIKMGGRVAKEVVERRKLLKSSLSTIEWLRNFLLFLTNKDRKKLSTNLKDKPRFSSFYCLTENSLRH